MVLTPAEIKDAILMALSSLRTNKLRSGLTIIGVMVGVGSVIGMAAVINGLNDAAEGEIDRMGSNIIMITKLPPNVDYDELSDEDRNRPWITEGEALAIQENCPSVDGAEAHAPNTAMSMNAPKNRKIREYSGFPLGNAIFGIRTPVRDHISRVWLGQDVITRCTYAEW